MELSSTAKRDILIISAIAAFVLLFKLGCGSLSSWDEAYYAHISRGLANSNTLTSFVWGEAAWLDKPLLYMWGTACFYKLLGISEFTTRLLSAICGIGVVILTYTFTTRLFSRKTGLLAALMMISTYHFVWFSKMGTLDVAFVFFLFLTIDSFLRSETKHINIIYSFIWFTFAFLTKGVGALLIPMILGVYVLMRRRWSMVVNRYTVFGILLFLFIGGGWFFVRFLLHGSEALEDHFIHHLIRRTFSTLDGHTGNWLTYINAVLYKGKPWGIVGLISLPFFIFWTIKKKQGEKFIIISWILVTFLIFTIAKTKLHWYIMPVYPAVIITAAWAANAVLRRYALLVVIVVSLISLTYFGLKKDIFTLDYNPEVKQFATEIEGISSETGSRVYLYGLGDPGMRFYFGGFGKNVFSETELVEIAREKGVIVVFGQGKMKAQDLEGEVISSEEGRFSAVIVK